MLDILTDPLWIYMTYDITLLFSSIVSIYALRAKARFSSDSNSSTLDETESHTTSSSVVYKK
ncbi:hypothetical protein ACP8HZ_05510 [Francisella noatunensis]